MNKEINVGKITFLKIPDISHFTKVYKSHINY